MSHATVEEMVRQKAAWTLTAVSEIYVNPIASDGREKSDGGIQVGAKLNRLSTRFGDYVRRMSPKRDTTYVD
ncbi:hypothetical protein SAMN05216316_3079 [Nitrosovibrio sp. Nv6]|nr:hypothetical protein SAMN05216316_3079 [Nitrosovibrio sp. Nv6]